MILCRLELRRDTVDPSQVLRLARDSYGLHQAIWDLFADHADRRRDFLYRLDRTRHGAVVYTLSRREPVDAQGLWRTESKRFEPVLETGDPLRFRVRVNPTVKHDGKRHDVVMDRKWRLQQEEVPRAEWPPEGVLVQDEVAAWLGRRAANCGFEPVEGSVRAEGHLVEEFRKPKGRKVRLGMCDLEGTLRVEDPARFLDTVESGLGPAKGFGCGLMLLARPGSIGG